MASVPRKRSERLGRNDPCFCGSGLKFKRCCQARQPKANLISEPSPDLTPEILRALEDFQLKAKARTDELRRMGIFIGLPNTVGFKGKRFLAIGNRLLAGGNENTTFHELILGELQSSLGKEWWEKESQNPLEEQHFIMKCYRELARFTLDAVDKRGKEGRGWSATPNGYAQSVLSLAFDLYLLGHRGSIPDGWLRRLRLHDQYQGVRYEVAIASIFARIGCRLEFYEDRRGTARHPEFIAFDPETQNKVAVEAKSRHRQGVIHLPGEFDLDAAMRGDVTQLFNNALQKDAGGLPYCIFIDINAPRDISVATEQTRWFDDIRRMVDRQHVASEQDPDRYTLLCVTNYSHHYEEDRIITPGQNCMIVPIFTEKPLADGIQGAFLRKLQAAINGYGFVPNL